MAALGSQKNPLILRVQTERRLRELSQYCDSQGWHFIIGLEPDELENIEDLERRERAQTLVLGPQIGRNDPCPCGTGKKYKKCCGNPLSQNL